MVNFIALLNFSLLLWILILSIRVHHFHHFDYSDEFTSCFINFYHSDKVSSKWCIFFRVLSFHHINEFYEFSKQGYITITLMNFYQSNEFSSHSLVLIKLVNFYLFDHCLFQISIWILYYQGITIHALHFIIQVWLLHTGFLNFCTLDFKA